MEVVGLHIMSVIVFGAAESGQQLGTGSEADTVPSRCGAGDNGPLRRRGHPFGIVGVPLRLS